MRKSDFPIFRKHPRLVYLDSAATAQKPKAVIEAMRRFLAHENAPVHRSLYPLGEKATAAFEGARACVARFIGAGDATGVIFTRNTTEAINIVACAWGHANVRRGDEVLVSRMEHHSNFVPWLLLAKAKGARLRIAELTTDGRLDLDDFKKKLSRRTKIVALTHASNVLGTVNPVARIARIIKNHSLFAIGHSPLFVVDAAQSAPHIPIDVRKLGCDFLAFSGHKIYGPTGVGVLWGKREFLEAMPPFLAGGHMIREVSERETTWNDAPWKFEAGTPDAAGAVGLAAAADYLERIGWENIVAHERELMAYALREFGNSGIREFVTVYGSKRPNERVGVIAFTVNGMHPHDVGSLLAEEGICVRAGHHCAMPLHRHLGVPATTRVSLGLYNDREDVDRFFSVLKRRVLPLAQPGI